MKRDFKTWMILLAIAVPLIPFLFITTIYFSNCGINNNCVRGNLAGVIHTPVPTLNAATLPVPSPSGPIPTSTEIVCNAPASTLLAAWVSSGSSENQPFTYTDPGGNLCAATFAELQPLFDTPNFWYHGSLACTTCHDAALSASSAGLDLSSFAGITAGSHRSNGASQGTDILGGGEWNSSILNQVLFVQKSMPAVSSNNILTDLGPALLAGEKTTAPGTTPTATVEIANAIPTPSNPGGTGEAVNLTGDPASGAKIFNDNCATCHGPNGTGGVTNPGSTDGFVPTLNPIDPLLKSSDEKIFAMNIDLFIQHGSTPEGANPFRTMPAWGDQNALTQQQIADVIAYLISLNK